jgi:dinuclear metal center YbgI/SA1388 family protein
MNVRNIYDFLDGLYPFSTQPAHDNSGLLVGLFSEVINKVLVCLDVTTEVVEEGLEKNADLIISHHPIMYNGVKRLTAGEPAYLLALLGMTHIAVHNPADIAAGGISDLMLERLGFPPSNIALDSEGYGRITKLKEPLTVTELAQKCKTTFNCTAVRHTRDNGTRKLARIAICGGSCGGLATEAINKNCEVLIGGDYKHAHWVEACNAGFALIDVGHFHSENIWCHDIAAKLRKQFPTLDVKVADNSKDLCSYVI